MTRLFCLAAILWVGGMIQPGCSSTPGSSLNTEDCAALSGDLAIALNQDSSLLASAVTSACDELAIFAGSGSTIDQVSVMGGDGARAEVVLDAATGIPTAVRTTEDLATLNINQTTGAVRINLDGTNSASATLAVDRDVLTNARRQVRQAGGQIDRDMLCAQLAVTTVLFEAIAAECTGAAPPAYCAGSVDEAARSVTRLCAATDVLQVDSLTNRHLPDQPQQLDLAIAAFATTRAAAGGGTTLILSALPIGGSGGYEVVWEQTAGTMVPLQILPGNAAVGDLPTRSGRFEFRVRVTDTAGATADDEAVIDLDAVVQLAITPSTTTPQPGSTVRFDVNGDLSQNATFFWTFGDGTNSTGRSVDHSYAAAGVFPVGLNVTILGRDISDSVNINVGQDTTPSSFGSTGEGGGRSLGDFFAEIRLQGTPKFLAPAESRQLGIALEGAVPPVDVLFSVREGPGIFNQGNTSVSGSGSSIDGPTLTAGEPGIIVISAIVVDAQDRVAEATRSIPVFAPQGGLYAAINGAFLVQAGVPATFEVATIGDVGTLDYQWFILNEPGTTADDGATLQPTRQAVTQLLGSSPGLLTLGVTVTDQTTQNQVVAYLGVEVFVFCPLQDPNCFAAQFCVAGDLFCDSGCGNLPDPDCSLCANDGVCVEFCPFPDPDCGQVFGCIPGDFVCVPGCEDFDPDCAEFCVGGDGICDTFCVPPDADCTTNAPICAETEFCCDNDEYCDIAECPQPDPQCGQCGSNGVCILECPVPDPDCGGSGNPCIDAGVCCPNDIFCDTGCPDPDPQCAQCGSNGVCILDCPAPDPDCSGLNALLCTQEGLCCPNDGFCDNNCPEPDPQCAGDQSLCDNSCTFAFDGECDDGGPGAQFNECPLGSDCADCGVR